MITKTINTTIATIHIRDPVTNSICETKITFFRKLSLDAVKRQLNKRGVEFFQATIKIETRKNLYKISEQKFLTVATLVK